MTITAIPFTQYMRPTGRPIPTSIQRPADITAKAEAIMARGLVFECEMLSDGTVSLTVTDPDEGDVDIELVSNGSDVPAAVDRLILRQSAT